MARTPDLDSRITEQNKKKQNQPKDDEPNDMELEMDRVRTLALNKQKSVFDSDSGNRTPGINTMPSVFEKTAVFHMEKPIS